MKILSRCHRGALVWSATLLVLTGGGLGFSQEPIHVAVNLVNVAFSVRDSQGTLIDSLSKEDVEIFEDAARKRFRSLRVAPTFR